jgi:hypothetical protein
MMVAGQKMGEHNKAAASHRKRQRWPEIFPDRPHTMSLNGLMQWSRLMSDLVADFLPDAAPPYLIHWIVV